MRMEVDLTDRTYDPQRAARIAGCGIAVIYNAIEEGSLPVVSGYPDVQIAMDKLLDFLEERADRESHARRRVLDQSSDGTIPSLVKNIYAGRAAMPVLDKLAYSIDDACQALSIGKSNFYKIVREGGIQTRTIGRRRIVTADALRSFIAGEAA